MAVKIVWHPFSGYMRLCEKVQGSCWNTYTILLHISLTKGLKTVSSIWMKPAVHYEDSWKDVKVVWHDLLYLPHLKSSPFLEIAIGILKGSRLNYLHAIVPSIKHLDMIDIYRIREERTMSVRSFKLKQLLAQIKRFSSVFVCSSCQMLSCTTILIVPSSPGVNPH